MSRKNKNSKNNQNISKKSSNQNDVVHIDYDELAKAMIKAQEEVKQHEEQEKKENHKKWQQKLGVKNPPTRLNNFCCGLKLFIFPKKYYSDNMNGTEFLMSTFVSVSFWLIEWFLYLMIIVGICNKVYLTMKIGFIIYLLGFLIFARIFRMARIEIDNLKDDNKIISIFSAVITFIAMVFTVISVIIAI